MILEKFLIKGVNFLFCLQLIWFLIIYKTPSSCIDHNQPLTCINLKILTKVNAFNMIKKKT